MEFSHPTYEPSRTISAIATPAGEGGIAVIRISGKNSLKIADRIFSRSVEKQPTHTVSFGRVCSPKTKETIDEVILLVMKAPKSFTGDDTVEIHCHGGSLITQLVLEATYDAGASPALPGEFSFKAFKNGKMDLAQAEGIQALISAKNSLSLKAAQDQLQGSLQKRVKQIQDKLIDLLANLEVWIDYPEEDLEFIQYDKMRALLEDIRFDLSNLVDSFDEGKKISAGIKTCILGPPNAGKSTLLNLLCDDEKAIVTDIAGTTRDKIEQEVQIAGLTYLLIDTAGVHETDHIVEKMGIEKSISSANEADLVLLVLDVNQPILEKMQNIIDTLPTDRTLVIWNKTDLIGSNKSPRSLQFPNQVYISAKDLLNIDELRSRIKTLSIGKAALEKTQIFITNTRHFNSLKKALLAIENAKVSLENQLSPEWLSSDIRGVLTELANILGVDATEEVLSSVFSNFCVGK